MDMFRVPDTDKWYTVTAPNGKSDVVRMVKYDKVNQVIELEIRTAFGSVTAVSYPLHLSIMNWEEFN